MLKYEREWAAVPKGKLTRGKPRKEETLRESTMTVVWSRYLSKITEEAHHKSREISGRPEPPVRLCRWTHSNRLEGLAPGSVSLS
jgi:hypothetical protein